MADEIRKCADLDERLAPYVDGEDAPSARRAVDTHLTGCPSCTGHARDESAARRLVHEYRETLGAQAPESLRARCELSASGLQLPASGSQLSASRLRQGYGGQAGFRLRKWVPLSLAATLVLAVAGVFVFGLNNRVQALAATLAVDHVKCFKVGGSPGEVDAHASERAWQRDQGWAVAVPANEPAHDLKLVDVRRCFSSDGRAAHMMYSWRGEPLSVYVMQGEGVREGLVRKMGAQAVMWCANQRTYAVVSSDTTRDLTPIVAYMKARVR
jgi:anti-sigma factor RsiW